MSAPAKPTLFLGDPEQPVEMAVNLVSAYVAKNAVPAADLPKLLHDVHAGIMALGNAGSAAISPGHHAPAADPDASVFPDRLVSLIDGRNYKSLKRHVGVHGYTPDSYREAFKLPRDYPMVCAEYAAQRSALAKRIGLGKAPKAAA